MSGRLWKVRVWRWVAMLCVSLPGFASLPRDQSRNVGIRSGRVVDRGSRELVPSRGMFRAPSVTMGFTAAAGPGRHGYDAVQRPVSGACACGWVRKSGFTGKERDAETGLDYFGARYMSSAQGRFTSPDEPLLDQYESDPQSWNLYSYVRNNPLRNIDPTGRTCVPDGNGGFKDIPGAGGTCADALKADIAEGKNPSATVTAQTPPSPELLALTLGMRRAEPVVNAAAAGTAVLMAGAGAGVFYGAYTGGTGLIALGVASGPALFRVGQIIDRVYHTSGGPVRFVAEVAVEGSQLVLKDILVYPAATGNRIAIGVKEVLQAARPLLEEARQAGYTSVRFIADRSLAPGSANPGRPVDFVKTLK